MVDYVALASERLAARTFDNTAFSRINSERHSAKIKEKEERLKNDPVRHEARKKQQRDRKRERRATDPEWAEKEYQRQRTYRQSRQEHYNELHRQWIEKNPEKMAQWNKEYREKNADRERERNAKYREENREVLNAKMRAKNKIKWHPDKYRMEDWFSLVAAELATKGIEYKPTEREQKRFERKMKCKKTNAQ